MKKVVIAVMLLSVLRLADDDARGEGKILTSRIVSVKLYQNQATITRAVRLRLAKGVNSVVLGNLSPQLYDWSVRGSLPADFKGNINSLEVEKKALITKRQKSIVEIEKKLEGLREKDQVHVDGLKNIASQEKFLDSILEFTNINVSKELATRIPQINLWENTLQYVAKKKGDLLREKRKIEKERETIGKEIQKWEFELSQIAGPIYFRNYQSLNKAILDNRSSMNVQQYADSTGQYEEKKRLFKNPTEKVDIEKRVNVKIFSPGDSEIDFFFSYVMPQTNWQMKYDIRASSREKNVRIVIYGDVYQKTGENWENIRLSLSTGMPVNAMSIPVLDPWYLDIVPVYPEEGARGMEKSRVADLEKKRALKFDGKSEEEQLQSTVREEGSYFEISLPSEQTIESSTKFQKKYVKEYRLDGEKNATFFFEATPEKMDCAYLKASMRNISDLPWLDGEAQIFLENEFMGKAMIPFTPPGKRQELILGAEQRIIVRKELVKKYEETAGILGGKRKILYTYKIIADNQISRNEEVTVCDIFPVSRNEKVKIEIVNLSIPFIQDEEFKNTTDYARGIRKWKLQLGPHTKKDITYDIIITFDKDDRVSGLR